MMNRVEKVYIIWCSGFILYGFGKLLNSWILRIVGMIIMMYLFIDIIYKEIKKRKR